jgi:selenide,water dikinase
VKRVLLIGAGHAHAVVLRALAKEPLLGARIDFVAPQPVQVYSGMLPGIVAGHYAQAEAEIDFRRLAERAYAEYVPASVVGLDLERRVAALSDGRTLGYDLASLNVGSRLDLSVPGAENALPAKPFERLLGALEGARRIALAGAGAAGAELAMALRYRGADAVTLYSEKAMFEPPLAQRVERVLRRAGVDFRPGMAIDAVDPGPLVHSGASQQEFDLVLLTTGARPLDWPVDSGLAADDEGYVRVARTLQSVSHPEVFAAGDCAAPEDAREPKSGVVSVRHGVVLHRNLTAAVRGLPLVPYEPDPAALALISCGTRYAIAVRGGFIAEGRWAWYWKNWIDRCWVRSLRA